MHMQNTARGQHTRTAEEDTAAQQAKNSRGGGGETQDTACGRKGCGRT